MSGATLATPRAHTAARRGRRAATDDWLEHSEVSQTARVVVLIPAHDEAHGVGATITSLHSQQRRPDRIIVVADNCTDDTARVARDAGAEVIATVGNRARKAGALNQGLAAVLSDLGGDDVVLAMDADSQLAPDFVDNALKLLAAHPDVGGLSGRVVGRAHTNLLELGQAVEFARDMRQVGRRGGRVHVLSGAASVIRAGVLRELARARGSELPGTPGVVYLEDSLTEDYELTLAVRKLGYRCVSTKHCRVVTDLMPTFEELSRQRVRWYRGAIESLVLYGWRRGLTDIAWCTIVVNYAASLLLPLLIVLIGMSIWLFDSWFDPRWLAIWPLMAAEQYLMARRVGVRLRAMPVLFFWFWAYDLLRYWFCWSALFGVTWETQHAWSTDERPRGGDACTQPQMEPRPGASPVRSAVWPSRGSRASGSSSRESRC